MVVIPEFELFNHRKVNRMFLKATPNNPDHISLQTFRYKQGSIMLHFPQDYIKPLTI